MKQASGDLFKNIEEAHRAIRPQVRITPLEHSAALSAALGCELYFKCDHLQPTGSFKIRGATNKLRLLGSVARASGVITASTGNHGLATAHAGALSGIKVTVYVAATTTQQKKQNIEALGARLVVIDGGPMDAELEARRNAADAGIPYVSPYNDLDVVAGQGTLGVELFEQAPDLDAVFVSVGCGGLIGGIGTALKQLRPQTRIVGVWPQNSPVLLRSLEAGVIVSAPEFPTLSDGTAGAVEPGSVTFPICQSVIDTTLSVNESQIADAMRRIAATERWMVEGAAGVAFAGLIDRVDEFKGKKVAVVLCGRNVEIGTFLDAVR